MRLSAKRGARSLSTPPPSIGKSGGAKPKDLQFSEPLLEMFFDRGVMGSRPTQGDENRFSSATAFNGSVTFPFASALQARRAGPYQTSAQPGRAGTQLPSIAERRRCGTARAGYSWKCFSTERTLDFPTSQLLETATYATLRKVSHRRSRPTADETAVRLCIRARL
jgi:hypothetical protein